MTSPPAHSSKDIGRSSDKKDDDALLDAQKAFHLGDYALTRKLALAIQSKSESTHSAAAGVLLDRLSPPSLTKYLLLLTGLLLLAVTAAAYLR